MAVAVGRTLSIITCTISMNYAILIKSALLQYAMMLHAQDKGSVALEALVIMLPYAWLEEHQLCFDGKNRQFFPFFAKKQR